MVLTKPFLRKKANRTFLNYVAKVSADDLNLISKLLDDKKLIPHIDKEFSLHDTSEALYHFFNGKTIGKTIIKVD